MTGDPVHEDDASTGSPVVASGRVVKRRTFIAGGAAAVASLALVNLPGRSVQASAVEPGSSYFVPMSPQRFCDTREGYGYIGLGDHTIRVPIGGVRGVPAGAVAVVLTLTGVNLAGGNWLSAYPSGNAWPGTASSNSEYFGQAVANLVIVKLGDGGAIDIRSLAPSHVVVDVAGYYLPAAGQVAAGRLETVEPFRILDTRYTGKPGWGQTVSVNLNGRAPADALAVIANVTAVETDGGGFVTAYPFGQSRPLASSLNYGPGEIRASAVVAKLGAIPGMIGFSLYTMAGAHLVVDVLGYITGPSSPASTSGLFVPIAPQRMLDTRVRARRVWPGGTVDFGLPAGMAQRAKAVAMNLAATSTVGPGFFTSYAAQTPRQLVSSLNVVRPGQTIANHTFSKVSTAGVACFSQSGAHIVADVTGWFTGGPEPATVARPVDPPPPGGPIPWLLQVPRMGLWHWVFDGDSKRIVDSGHTWHWTGTGLVGQGTNIVLFGHRTDAGGPFRNQHDLRAGDDLTIYTSDQRRYTYRMVAEFITSRYPNDILAATRRVGGETVSLVACSKTNRLPTSLSNRIVSTFQLVGWDDLG
jgi:hypothetical protein